MKTEDKQNDTKFGSYSSTKMFSGALYIIGGIVVVVCVVLSVIGGVVVFADPTKANGLVMMIGGIFVGVTMILVSESLSMRVETVQHLRVIRKVFEVN